METKITHPDQHIEGKRLRSIFKRKVLAQQISIGFEKLIPRAMPLYSTFMVAGTATFLGMWQHIPENYRPYLYIPIVASAILPIPFMGGFRVNKKNPRSALKDLYNSIYPYPVTKEDALLVLDRHAESGTRPAAMLSSKLPDNSPEIQKKSLRAYQDKLLKEKLGTLKVTMPRPKLSHVLSAVALTISFGASALIAGDQRTEKLEAAFNFTPPKKIIPPPKLWASISPPNGITKIKPVYLEEHKDQSTVHTIHPKSTLAILSDRLVKITAGKHILELSEKITGNTEKTTYKFKPIILGEEICKKECDIIIEDGPTWKIKIRADQPPQVIVKDIDVVTKGEAKALQLRCKASDDFGIKDGELVLKVPKAHISAKPPRQAQLPKIKIPRNKLCP